MSKDFTITWKMNFSPGFFSITDSNMRWSTSLSQLSTHLPGYTLVLAAAPLAVGGLTKHLPQSLECLCASHYDSASHCFLLLHTAAATSEYCGFIDVKRLG